MQSTIISNHDHIHHASLFMSVPKADDINTDVILTISDHDNDDNDQHMTDDDEKNVINVDSEKEDVVEEESVAESEDEDTMNDESIETDNELDNESDEDDEDEEDDDDDDDDDDDTIYLGPDIKIKNVLKSRGYRKLSKLVTTDQGSVWRAKAPKKLSKKYKTENVVIKIASKIHYESMVYDDEKSQKNKSSKRLSRNLYSEHENILKEIEIVRRLNVEQCDCPNNDVRDSIIRVIDTIDDDLTNNFMMILEDGGKDLFNFTKECHKEIAMGTLPINEWKKTVKLIAKKLINLIHWMHNEMLLCHLDISLENILISNISWINYQDQNGHWKKKLSPEFKLKMIDFGACKLFNNIYNKNNISYQCKSVIGKPSYCCPEIFNLQSKRTTKTFDARHADIWSFGVSLFILAIGCPPWQKPDEINDARFQTIVLYKNLDYLLNCWKRSHFMDNKMKDILNKIFVMTEKDRISTKEIIKHSWLC